MWQAMCACRLAAAALHTVRRRRVTHVQAQPAAHRMHSIIDIALPYSLSCAVAGSQVSFIYSRRRRRRMARGRSQLRGAVRFLLVSQFARSWLVFLPLLFEEQRESPREKLAGGILICRRVCACVWVFKSGWGCL